MTYTGWLLPERDRAKLLQIFYPVYHDVIAHHVTLTMGAKDLPTATSGTVVGIVDDSFGVQALIVSIDGTTERPDGRTYHITWSLDRELFNRKPVHSNDAIRDHGWEPVFPVPISLVPMVFED